MGLIIKRKSGKVENLFWVSTNPDLNRQILSPAVPDNFLTRGKFQDWQLPRTRLYPTIDDALSGLFLGEPLEGMSLTVYKAQNIRNESLIRPSITAAPYSLVLDEWWYLGNLYLQKLGTIKIGKEKSKQPYHYGPRSTLAYIRRWEWKEVLKKWEKSQLK